MQRRSSVAASAGSCIDSEARAAKRVGALAISTAIQSLAWRASHGQAAHVWDATRTKRGRFCRVRFSLRAWRGEAEELHLDAGLIHLNDSALDIGHGPPEQVGALLGGIELGLGAGGSRQVERLFADDLSALGESVRALKTAWRRGGGRHAPRVARRRGAPRPCLEQRVARHGDANAADARPRTHHLDLADCVRERSEGCCRALADCVTAERGTQRTRRIPSAGAPAINQQLVPADNFRQDV